MTDAIAFSTSEELLIALLAVMGRVAIPEPRLRAIVSPQGAVKYFAAYSLCDGKRSMSDVARASELDASNFSKAVAKWVEAGVLFRLGKDQRLLGLYPLPPDIPEPNGSERQILSKSTRGSRRHITPREKDVPDVGSSKVERTP
jgi:hypothetical protein